MDKNSKAFFRDDLIFLDLAFKDRYEFLEFIGAQLIARGHVKETFTEGLLTREAKYPTGLPAVPYAVAIPHCDPEHVHANTISIVRFKEPIQFYEMGTLDQEIHVKFAFVLTLDGQKQVLILRDLMKLFMDAEFMQQLHDANEDQVKSLINNI